MTPQIKQRIEQIRRGEVPDGYKRTKVGLVPEEWKIKRLAQVLRKQTCKNTDNAIHNVLTNSATRGIVDQKDYFDKQIANSENTDNYYIVENGYFVYNPRISVSAPCGPFNKYYGCEKGIMSPLYTVYKYIDCSTDYTEYLSYFFSSANWHRYMNSIANYGARNDRMNVTSDTMSAMPLPYPPLPEQKKIAEILQTQDKLIALQQKKIEELKKLKKAYLSKMFPKKGCNVPEIRFPGFTDPWEQRKAIDIADYSKGNGYSKGDLTDAGTPIILYGRLYTKYQFAISEVDTFAVPQNGAVYSQGNEVIVPASGETAEDIARASAVEKSGVLLGGDLNILRPFDFINPLFLALAISNGEPQKELAKKAQGKSVVHIHNTDIQEVTIAYPSKTEQDRIVSVFRHLDNLITLHQRKLEEMKIYKKSLMQLLLTGIVRM